MTKQTITLRLEATHRAELDQLASHLDRDRNDLIGEAISTYLDIQRWQLEEIESGLRQAKAGDFAGDEEVEAAFTPS